MEQLINNFSLTLPQQDIYFEQILYPNDTIYNIGAKIEIRGSISKKIVLKLAQTFKLPKDFSIQLSSFYNSRRISGVSYINDFQRMHLSIDKKIQKWESRVQLSCNDIFGCDYSYESIDNIQKSFVLESYEPRVIRLTFTYNFGNSQLKKERKRNTGSDEIKERI